MMDYPVLNALEVGMRIKELRKHNHMTVAGLAEILGLESEQAIYKWQRAVNVINHRFSYIGFCR